MLLLTFAASRSLQTRVAKLCLGCDFVDYFVPPLDLFKREWRNDRVDDTLFELRTASRSLQTRVAKHGVVDRIAGRVVPPLDLFKREWRNTGKQQKKEKNEIPPLDLFKREWRNAPAK